MKSQSTKGSYLLIDYPLNMALAVRDIRKREHPGWSSMRCGVVAMPDGPGSRASHGAASRLHHSASIRIAEGV